MAFPGQRRIRATTIFIKLLYSSLCFAFIFIMYQVTQNVTCPIFQDTFYKYPSQTTTIDIHINSSHIRFKDTDLFEEQGFHPEGCRWSPGTKVTRILVLSLPRSGSSVTGELLSSGEDDVYFFEPFYHMRKALEKPEPSSEDVKKALQILNDILNCSSTTIDIYLKDKWGGKILRKLPHKENMPGPVNQAERNLSAIVDDMSPKALVVKVIRLSMTSQVVQWLQTRPYIHVVLLVRDPRAIIFSMTTGKKYGMDVFRPAYLCGLMATNLNATLHLNPKRYSILRYEDLIQETEETTKLLFERVGRQRTPSILQYIAKYLNSSTGVNGKNISKTYPDYFSTKLHNADVHSWKKGLSAEQIWAVENECSSVHNILGYESFTSSNLVNMH